MKRSWIILVLGLALGAIGFELLYFHRTAAHRKLMQECGPELAWIKKEFRLNEAEFNQIRVLHGTYRPVCARYCRRIETKEQELARLLATSDGLTPAAQQALDEAADLEKECLGQMLRHFYAVSQAMPPEEGRHYLEHMQTETIRAHRTMRIAEVKISAPQRNAP